MPGHVARGKRLWICRDCSGRPSAGIRRNPDSFRQMRLRLLLVKVFSLPLEERFREESRLWLNWRCRPQGPGAMRAQVPAWAVREADGSAECEWRPETESVCDSGDSPAHT